MTLSSLMNDLMVFALFLLIGFLMRELIKPLQKWFLPASIIGGVMALLCSEQMLGLVTLPESFSGFAGTLTNFLMAGLVFGVRVNMKKFRSYADYFCVCVSIYGAQIVVGVLLGTLLSRIWTTLPEGWGVLGHMAFHAGHGGATIGAQALEDAGVAGAMSFGMILATVGLIVAMVVGMPIVNYGIRKGWTKYVTEVREQPPTFYGGIQKPEERKAIGRTTTSTLAVNPLIFQIAMVLASMWLGGMISKGAVALIPALSKVSSMLWGIIGAIIVFQLLVLLKLDGYVDKQTVNTVNSAALEIIVLTAIATLRLDIVTQNWVPLVIYCIIMTILTIALAFPLAKRFCSDEWFEKACMLFGMATGTTSTGLALVRAIDPDSQSSAPEAHGVYASVSLWVHVTQPMFPVMVLTSIWPVVGFGALFFLIPVGAAYILFGRRK